MTDTTSTTDHEDPGDDYILVEGGLVQNSPALPVFDMDIIGDVPIEGQIDEAIDLAERMYEHDGETLAYQINRIIEYVKNYGSNEDTAKLSALFRDEG